MYLPPGYDAPANANHAYPVLYLNDGFAVFSSRLWNAPAIVDSLLAAGSIVPLIVVGIDNAASIPGSLHPGADRTNEFLPFADSLDPDAQNPRGWDYTRFIIDEVMPLIHHEFRIDTATAMTGIGGSSYGGIAALTAVLAHPGRFGRLLLESTPLFMFRERLTDSLSHVQAIPHLITVGVGADETSDTAIDRMAREAVERFVRQARQRIATDSVRFIRTPGAVHSSGAWRQRFPGDLVFLFGVR